MTVDPVTLEVLANATGQIIAEITDKMMKTGYSSIVKESGDVSFAICDGQGRVVGQQAGVPVLLGVLNAQTAEVLRRYGDSMMPDDAYIVNHPYQACQNHATDITIISPVFHNGRRIALVANTAHKPDLGGKVPGTNAGDATDLFQEGLLIPPLPLYRAGQLDETLHQMIVSNTRTPEVTWGDIQAQVLSNRLGAEKIAGLISKFGPETVVQGWQTWLEIAERELRRRIRELVPEGSFGPVTDYMDDDGIDLDRPLAITVTMARRGDDLVFTYQSGPQTRGPVNLRPCVTRSITEYAVKAALAPDLPRNWGFSQPIHIEFPPEGSMLNPRFPAPVNMYSNVVSRIGPLLMMVFAQAVPDRVAAPGAGALGAISFAGVHPRTHRWFSQYEILAGGYGARPTKDGVSGMTHDGSNVKNTPVEAVEAEFPVMVDCYEVIPDSAGAGKYRGGLGVRRQWRILQDDVVMNLRADRFKFSSPGVFGARPARPSRCVLDPGTDHERPLHSKVANLRLRSGQVVRWELAGGGGWGDPRQRDPAAVREDVLDGYVTIQQARETYGVVLDPETLEVDEEATASLRAPGARLRGQRPDFSL